MSLLVKGGTVVNADHAQRADVMNVPLYIVHNSYKESVDAIARARAQGQRVFGEALAGHMLIDDSVYQNKDWDTAGAEVMLHAVAETAEIAQ